MPSLLIVGDDSHTREVFRAVSSESDVEVLVAPGADDAARLCAADPPSLVFMDIGGSAADGIESVRRLREACPSSLIVCITPHDNAETAIEATKLGAFEYLVKPIAPERLRSIVKRGLDVGNFMSRSIKPVACEDAPADRFVGHSPPMQEVYKAIGRVAAQDVTVLVLGESGTGKELAARAIHQHSRRSDKPFLTVNCAAIPESLLESEFFGHERGAFTGADRRRIGKFEQCHGGTLFLDEVGDMTPLTQSKLLRVLQDQQFERVGGTETIRTDVRVIAATNRDLKSMLHDGRFRADLFYRLNTFTLNLAPLRNRQADLPLLVDYFLARFAREMGKSVRSVPPATMERLRVYPWPGNIRELQSVIKQALLQANGSVLAPEFLPEIVRAAPTPTPQSAASPQPAGEPTTEPTPTAPEAPAPVPTAALLDFIDERLRAGSQGLYADTLAWMEQQLITEVLRRTGGNQSEAGRLLGINRGTLKSKIVSLGISIGAKVELQGRPRE